MLYFLWYERHEFGSHDAILENAVQGLFTSLSGPLAKVRMVEDAIGLLSACWSECQGAWRRRILKHALCIDGILTTLLEVVAKEIRSDEDAWAMELLEMAAIEEESALSIFSSPKSIALLLRIVKDECVGWSGWDDKDYVWRPCAANILICLLERDSETRKSVLSASGAVHALRSFTTDPDVEQLELKRVAAARIEELLQAKIE